MPLIICRWKPTRPWLSKPVARFMTSADFISGPSRLSLLAKFDMFNVEAIWFTLDLKLASMSFRRFISFSELCIINKNDKITVCRQNHLCLTKQHHRVIVFTQQKICWSMFLTTIQERISNRFYIQKPHLKNWNCQYYQKDLWLLTGNYTLRSHTCRKWGTFQIPKKIINK